MAALVAAALACAIFLNALPNDFTFDDLPIVSGNPLVTDGGLWPALSSHYWAGTAPAGNLYRPLTTASFWLNHRLAGSGPDGFHLINILLHGAVTALLYLLARRLADPPAAAAAAILFAVHPVHTEAVASIVGRADLLAALFVLAAWLLRRRPILSALLFLAGLLSKESAIVLPALLLVEDAILRRRGPERARPAAYAPHLAAIAVFLLLRAAVIGSPLVGRPMTPGSFAGVSASDRLLTAIAVIGSDLRLLIWPATLSADYGFNQIPIVTSPAAPGFLAGVAGLLVCAVLALATRRRAPAIALGILVFFAALAPVANVFFPIGVILAERLLYLPSAGLCLAAGAAIGLLLDALGAPRRPASRLAAACLVAAAPGALLAARAWTRTADWRDQRTLFEATVRASPDSALAHVNLGSVYQSLGRLQEAEAEYRRGIAIGPERKGAHHNLGTVLEATGRIEEAIAVYRDALRIDPTDWETANNLGRALLSLGRSPEAIPVLEQAVKQAGDRPAPMGNLAAAYLHAGDLEAAGRLAERVLASHPDDAAARRVLDAVRERAP